MICAVFNSSKDYVNRFLMYFKDHRQFDYEVIGFTSQKALEDHLSDSMVDILLLSRDLLTKNEHKTRLIKREEEPDKRIILHVENVQEIIILGEQQDLKSEQKCIDIYRSMKSIAQDISDICTQLKIKDDRYSDRHPDIYAFYSLNKDQDPFLFARKLADTFPEGERTLYIDLDTFSGLTVDGPVISGMSDVIFGYLSDMELFRDTLLSSIRTKDSMSILCPAVFLKDLDEISASGWNSFLGSIAQTGGFSSLILNISDSCRDLPGLFGTAKEIYIFEGNTSSAFAQARKAAFTKYFESRGRTDITEKFRMPF